MKQTDVLKLAVFEAHSENLITDSKRDEMLTFCENADLNNRVDFDTFVEMTEELIAIGEAAIAVDDSEGEIVKESVVDPETEYKKLKLNIFESEACGDITAEERNELLEMLG